MSAPSEGERKRSIDDGMSRDIRGMIEPRAPVAEPSEKCPTCEGRRPFNCPTCGARKTPEWLDRHAKIEDEHGSPVVLPVAEQETEMENGRPLEEAFQLRIDYAVLRGVPVALSHDMARQITGRLREGRNEIARLRARPSKEAHYERLIQAARVQGERIHPWYGVCDTMGTDGWCAECEKVWGERQPTEDEDEFGPVDLTGLKPDRLPAVFPTRPTEDGGCEHDWEHVGSHANSEGLIGICRKCKARRNDSPTEDVETNDEWRIVEERDDAIRHINGDFDPVVPGDSLEEHRPTEDVAEALEAMLKPGESVEIMRMENGYDAALVIHDGATTQRIARGDTVLAALRTLTDGGT